jgi:hypothetical protein
MADLFLVFKEASILFSIEISYGMLPAVHEGSFFPTSLPTFVVVGSYSNRSEVKS